METIVPTQVKQSWLARLLINRQFALLWSVVLRNVHTTFWGARFGSVDIPLLGAGVLVVLGGLYAMVNLRYLPPVRQDVEQPAEPAEVSGATSSN